MNTTSKYFMPAFLLAFSIVIAVSISSCSSTTSTPGGTTTPTVFNDSDIAGGIFKPASKPGGKTYNEWSSVWWQWAYGTPATNPPGVIYHPLLEADTNGTHASLGDQGSSSMFFLGGLITKASSYNIIRKVSIPHTDAIFFPVAALLEDPIVAGTSRVDTMQNRLQSFAGSVSEVNVKLDGNIIFTAATKNLYRERSATFTYSLPQNNIYQYLGGTTPASTVTPAIADGYYVMLAPLAAGTHTLYFNATLNSGVQQTTYKITSY